MGVRTVQGRSGYRRASVQLRRADGDRQADVGAETGAAEEGGRHAELRGGEVDAGLSQDHIAGDHVAAVQL